MPGVYPSRPSLRHRSEESTGTASTEHADRRSLFDMKVLAVCLGNICRSPAAEAAIVEAASEAGVDIEVDSAGTGAYHVGEPPDERMRRAAALAGLSVSGRARQFEPGDFDRFDLIVVMDRHNLRDVLAQASDEEAAGRVQLFRAFDPEAEPDDLDVPDPYYGGTDGFRHVVDMVRRAAAGLVAAVDR